MGISTISITNYALATNQQWPFVTLSNFQVQASNYENEAVGGFAVGAPSLSVVVKSDQKKQWERYAALNSQEWIEKSADYLELDYDTFPPITPSIYYLDRENGTKIEYNSTTPLIPEEFAPIWMVSVSDPTMIETIFI